MITISSEKNLFSQVLAMIILFILPSNLYHTPIPHKLGLFCRNLAFWTCDWQSLVCVVTWSQEDSFCFCRVLGNRTKCEHSANSANSVKALYKRKVFPPPDVSARKPREGLALREGGRGGDRAIGGVALEQTQLPLHLQLEREVALHCSSDFAEVLWFSKASAYGVLCAFCLYTRYYINPLSSFRRPLPPVLKSYYMITHIQLYIEEAMPVWWEN